MASRPWVSDAQWQQGVRGAKRGQNMQAGALYVDGYLVETKVVAKKIKVNKCVLKL